MKPQRRLSQKWLLRTALTVRDALKTEFWGGSLHLGRPRVCRETDTDGLYVDIGHLGRGQPSLEIWYDRYAGHKDRKLSACFWSTQKNQIEQLVSRVALSLPPVRVLRDQDFRRSPYAVMNEKLKTDQFSQPIQEHYQESGNHFFAIYDPTETPGNQIDLSFCERATAFFGAVLLSLPKTQPEDSERKTYPRCENRKWVEAHLKRERSRYLAEECKRRDKYQCQVCHMTFIEAYGRNLGALFAEAHHVVALANQPDKLRTKIEDLVTVCANCHRMLHRMEGNGDDLKTLKAIVRKYTRRRLVEQPKPAASKPSTRANSPRSMT